MDIPALLFTLLLCLASVALEILILSPAGKKWFESLVQPRGSLSLTAWYVAGGIYYVLFGIICYRQVKLHGSLLHPQLFLIVLLLLLNGLGNLFLFRHRSLPRFFFFLIIFLALQSWLCVLLYPQDPLAFGLALAYLGWLIYDLYYFGRLWKQNKNR